MTATILPFSGIRREFHHGRHGARIARDSAEAIQKTFAPDQLVIIANYDWDIGDTEVPATVVKQDGEWVHVRIPDVGSYSAHVSVVHALTPEAA
jgi:hypothetical protein